jgi:hypothetical protein
LEGGGFSNVFGDYSVAHIEAFGYLRLEADSNTLTADFVMNDTGGVWDTVTLTKWGDQNGNGKQQMKKEQ